MVGTRVGHFKVLEKIGSGGMGVVYKAQDLALDRIVALKSLRQDAAGGSMATAQLLAEARTAAILDHSNICTIYEVLQTQDQVFVAMAYYAGETVYQKLKAGPLPRPQAIAIARDVAAGLAKAHQHGIIHQDIKPGNVMVTQDGVVKILDFGLATLVSAVSTRGGTVAYMAPEQLRGDPIDERTDVWSWGVLLYQMLTRQLPFGDMGKGDLIRATLQDPVRLSDSLQAPAGLLKVLCRALEKDPADRYSRIAEARGDLDRYYRPDIPAGRVDPSIAVLPFRSLSRDREDEYFSQGLTEELTDALTRLEGLHVASRGSVIAFSGGGERSEIAKNLGVGLLLEGSVRRSQGRLRINTQLIHVDEDRELWSERFDRDIADIFAVQEEIASSVVGALKARLAGSGIEPPPVKRYTPNSSAYHRYLKGRYQWNRGSPESLFKSRENLTSATEADSGYVPAFCALSECYLVLGARSLLAPVEAWRKAREAAGRALALDPGLAEAHGCLGAVLAINDFNWAAAEEEFHRGLALNRDSAPTHHWYAIALLAPLGRFGEAVEEASRAVEAEPLSLIYNSTLSWIYYLSRQWDLAAIQCAKTLEIDPVHVDSLWCLGASYRQMGRLEEAVAAIKKLDEVSGGIPLVYGSLGHYHARMGNAAEAERMLAAMRDLKAAIYCSPVCGAWIHANLPGHRDAALDCLYQALVDRDFMIRYVHFSPALESLYEHPRFQTLLHQMNLPAAATDESSSGDGAAKISQLPTVPRASRARLSGGQD
jgi:TolB-like protein/tRNA A-37 threonylcarbamoyl transferase component Bud32